MTAARLSNAAYRIENVGLFIGPPTVINAHGPFFLHRSERHLEITADPNGSGDCFALAVVPGFHLVKRVINDALDKMEAWHNGQCEAIARTVGIGSDFEMPF